jgi:chemotaxis protein methyltransferase CheR
VPQQRTDTAKEFDFTRSDFERVRALIYQRAGISLADSKQEMVYSRLARRLRATGIQSFVRYLDDLEAGRMATEWEAFTNALTTNLTSFFREAHHFPLLAEQLAGLQRRDGKPLTIWCSAASTGEEPYSIAMTACEAFNSLSPPVQIVATDIDTNVLAVGATGVYPMERVDKVGSERLKRFFLKGRGANEGMARVRPELRQLVSFRQLNLLANEWPVEGQFDAIFCRNVMIYFDKDTQRKILARFVPLMKPHALLFAGHSENFLYVSDSLRLRGKTVYELDQVARRHPF